MRRYAIRRLSDGWWVESDGAPTIHCAKRNSARTYRARAEAVSVAEHLEDFWHDAKTGHYEIVPVKVSVDLIEE